MIVFIIEGSDTKCIGRIKYVSVLSRRESMPLIHHAFNQYASVEFRDNLSVAFDQGLLDLFSSAEGILTVF